MRHPRILDVMRAVRAVARAHEEIRAFWYAPTRRLPLGGDASAPSRVPEIEVVVEPRAGAAPDFARLGRELSDLLRPAVVHVRAYRGDAEERHLFRLTSRAEVFERRAHGEGS